MGFSWIVFGGICGDICITQSTFLEDNLDKMQIYIKVFELVKSKASIVSVLLISIFVGTIVAEGLQLHGHVSDHQAVSQHQEGEHSSGSNECNDPCHAGQCHFGHCSHMFFSETNGIVALLLSIPYQSTEFLALNHTFLNQLSRPPRLS